MAAVAPGVYVSSRAQVPPRSAPTDTGMTFMLGLTEKGPDTPTEVTSFQDYEDTFGIRTGFTDLYDAVEAYYQEGGAKLTIQRVGGTTTVASGSYPTGGTVDDVLAWVDGDAGRAEQALEREQAQSAPRSTLVGELETIQREGGASSHLAPLVEGIDLPAPRVPPADLPTGLDLLTSDLGPGQVVVPGTLGTDPAAHTALLEHAAATNRIALLDPVAAAQDAAALEALAGTLSGAPEARYGALFAPTALVPSIAYGGALRAVPYSAIAAGIIARVDAVNSPNVPAAGPNGVSRFAVDLAYTYSDVERGDLNEAGVDLARIIYGQVETYGFRTLAPVDTGWVGLNNARLNMALVAEAEAIGERYVFRQIDGRGLTISQFGADLTAMLIPYYEQGSLFGVTADDAFYVDVGSSVNTPATIAAGELHAVLAVRMSPFAERVYIEIVKTATETPLALAA